MKIEILQYRCITGCGPNLWDNLSGDTCQDQPLYTLLELLKDFLETQPQWGRIVCSQPIADSLLRFGITEVELFPDHFKKLCETIAMKPTWYLAGSDSDTSLIACLIQESEQGFTLHEHSSKTGLDALFVIGSDWPPSAKHRFDLRPLKLSREQVGLLSLIGAAEVLKSDLFDCETVGILHEDGLLLLGQQGG
jgi:hypothetical protein